MSVCMSVCHSLATAEGIAGIQAFCPQGDLSIKSNCQAYSGNQDLMMRHLENLQSSKHALTCDSLLAFGVWQKGSWVFRQLLGDDTKFLRTHMKVWSGCQCPFLRVAQASCVLCSVSAGSGPSVKGRVCDSSCSEFAQHCYRQLLVRGLGKDACISVGSLYHDLRALAVIGALPWHIHHCLLRTNDPPHSYEKAGA